jgi:glycosyltransferase involved in cell wall biosynthesis
MRYGNESVGVVNTNNWRKHPIKFIYRSFRLVASSKKVAIAPADNGFKIFVPLLMFINFFYRRDLIYIVIGGFLPALLKSKPAYLRMVNKFAAVFVQTANILKDLKGIGVNNLYILSNPKRLNTRKESDLKLIEDKEIKVCVFSRIYTDKGVEDAIEAVKIANKKLGGEYIKIDLYGLLPVFYKKRLQQLLDENKTILSYNGIIAFDKTVETLKDYFLMLFPTYYHGEGFPGNVVDAYNTGLPMIATDWLYNSDVVLDGKTGLLVPIKNPEALCDAILRLYNDRPFQLTLAKNSLKEAIKYLPDTVLTKLYEFIEK